LMFSPSRVEARLSITPLALNNLHKVSAIHL
jgi:hypothetical protein